MSVKESLLAVGLNKNGEMDFGVLCTVADLSFDQMQQLRAMTIVAIGTMEDMWRREQAAKNPAAQAGGSR